MNNLHIYKKHKTTSELRTCAFWKADHFGNFQVVFTARVRSTTGRLCFDTWLSVCPQGGVPISHNALQHFPECNGADTCQVQLGGRYPAWWGTLPGGVTCWGGGTLPGGGYPPRGVPYWGVPRQGVPCQREVPLQGTTPARSGWGGTLLGGYLVRTTEEVDLLTTQWVVCLLPPAYIVRWEGYVLTCVCLSVHRGVPISHNALQHFPECHGEDTWRGTLSGLAEGYPARGTLWGVPCQGVPCWGYPCRVPPLARSGGGYPAGGYPVKTTEGVLTTRWVVCLLHSHRRTFLLPPTYVVWQEGYVLTCVCLSTGGYPYPIMLCNISQNAIGQTPGGYPARAYPVGGRYPARGVVPCWGWYPAGGGTLPGGTLPGGTLPGGTLPGGTCWGYPARGYPAWRYPGRVPPSQVRMGGTLSEGLPYQRGGTQVGYPPSRVSPQPGQDRGGTLLGGDTQLGQQKEYSLHGGRYASCVHAGGLSC